MPFHVHTGNGFKGIFSPNLHNQALLFYAREEVLKLVMLFVLKPYGEKSVSIVSFAQSCSSSKPFFSGKLA